MIITCPNCNISGNGPDDKNGKKVTCGKCGTVFTVGEDLFKEVEVTIQPVEPVKDVLNKPIVHSKQKMNLMITVIVIITIIIMMVFKWDMNMNMFGWLRKRLSHP
ncbi:MAG: zinc-ribbon domain-containing protein, partial [bacterium]